MLSVYKALFLGLILFQFNLSFGQGKIIMNGATMNMKNSVYVVTTDVSLTTPSLLNVNNSTIKIAGTISSNNNIDVQAGTVEMNGTSSQTIPANSFAANKIQNLIIGNDVTLAGEDSLTGVLSFGALDSKTFSTGGFLTLKSTASRTANVADLTNNDVNSGNQVLGDVSVERYIPAVKKWRFLSIPTGTTQNIKGAWQEGCSTNANCLVNFGTQITGAGGTAAGFDIYTATPSMKTYSTATNSWIAVPNTNAALINNTSNNTIAYMLFVRGDRTATTLASPVTPTVLRTKGVIKQGDQAVITIASPATAFTAVGNPYPSQIDLRKMTPAPTTATKIYVWDPLATIGSAYGLGAYQTLTFDGSDFSVTPGGGSYGSPYNKNPNYIESGEAFFVGGNASAYDITFREDIKPSIGILAARPYRRYQSLKAGLYINNNGTTSLMDGVKADIATGFYTGLDDDDAYKMLNSSENVSLKRNGQLLSVERHNAIAEADTFYLNLTNLKVQNYQWQINLDNLDEPGLRGFFEDNYLQTSTPLNLNGSTNIDFRIENIPASYAANRFRIVFNHASVLPLGLTSVKAYQKDRDIAVEWKVENESNMKQYVVEKSADGNRYANATTIAANNLALSNYNWLDVDPVEGNNYYRIKSTDISGKTVYSKVVNVFIKRQQAISVYPNPVINGAINLRLKNQPEGMYGIRLLNKTGQVMMSKQVKHAEGSGTEKIQLNKNSAHGIYQLEVVKPDGNKVTINVIY